MLWENICVHIYIAACVHNHPRTITYYTWEQAGFPGLSRVIWPGEVNHTHVSDVVINMCNKIWQTWRTSKSRIVPLSSRCTTVGSFCVPPRNEALIPLSSKPAVWSCIRLMAGVSTKVTLLVISEGSWKHKLFPEPVGCITRVFLPSMVACSTLSCQSFSWLNWKCFTSLPVSCVSNWSREGETLSSN